jgi:hypothetical protein
MKNKQTIEKNRIENAKFELAFRKRHHAYRTSFEKLKRNFQTEDGLLSGDCEDILFREMSFSIWAAPELSFAADEGTLLEVLDPDKEIDGNQHAWLLFFMFYSPGLHEIRAPHLNPSYNYHKTKERPEDILVDELKDHERLLRVDLRKPKTALIREFTEFITNIHTAKKIAKMPNAEADKERAALFPIESLRIQSSYKKRLDKSFEAWEPDTTRMRKEAWSQLKIWDLWKAGQGYKRIAREIGMTVDAVKMAFHKAYERIYNRPYDAVDVWENESRKIPKPDIKQFCKDCPLYPCQSPCPEYLELIEAYVSEGYVSQKEKLISSIRNLPQDCEDPLEWLNEKNK